jgi:hypothetical protein
MRFHVLSSGVNTKPGGCSSIDEPPARCFPPLCGDFVQMQDWAGCLEFGTIGAGTEKHGNALLFAL